MNMKVKINFKDLLLSGILVVLFLLLFLYSNMRSYTYALNTNDNLMDDYYLNPEWIKYIESTEEEKARYNLVPSKFLYRYQNVSKEENRSSSLLGLGAIMNKKIEKYPSYYNLHDLGLVTAPKDQGSTGLCWAFAANSSFESSLLVSGISSIDNPITFSERQLDYASVSSNFIAEKYNPYYENIRMELGSGGFSNTPYELYSIGVSPVTTDVFGEFNEDLTTIKSLDEVFSIDSVEYSVDGYERIGLIASYDSYEDRQSFILKIKEHIMKYGALSFVTIGVRSYYGGSCLYYDEENQNYLINVLDYNCNPKVTENAHSMSIIGWDDDYEYKYCRNSDSTTSDLTNCSNIISGKGAFILKNSWGSETPYPYIAYDSNFEEVIGTTSVSVKNWDNNYDKLKSYSIQTNVNEYVSTFYTDSRLNEKLEKISFDVSSTSLGSTFNIFVSIAGDDYIEVGEVNIDYVGRHSIDIDSYLITEDNFKVKFIYDSGSIFDVYAFTSYVEESDTVQAYTFIENEESYNSYISELQLYTYTRNISNGGVLEYRLLDEDGVDISSLIEISNTMVFNNASSFKISFIDKVKFQKITLQTIFNNQVLDNLEINISQVENLWQAGDGSINDPYIIYTLEDFLNIGTSEAHMAANYKLGADIDFSSLDWNTNMFTNELNFTGSLDGNGYMLFGFSCSGTWCSIFGDVEDAVFKNLIISDFEVVDGGSWSSVLVASAINSVFENIVMTESVNVSSSSINSGGLVTIATDSTFHKIANYGTFEVTSDYASVGGIVNSCYGCEISESYNYGTIKVFGNVSVSAGGIVGGCYSSANTFNYTEISDVYNYGTVISDNYAGGIAGICYSGYIRNSYNISKYEEQNGIYGNIVGKSFGLVLRNVYYDSNGKNSLGEDLNNLSTFINVGDKSLDLLKLQSTYYGFDFDNVWSIDDGFPYLKNFTYNVVEDLFTFENIILNLGEESKLEVIFVPENTTVKRLIYKSSDESVVSIDNNGNMEANGIGSTIITVKTLDSDKISKSITVQVIPKLISNTYKIIDNYYVKINRISTREEVLSYIEEDNSSFSFKLSESNKKNICTGDKLFMYDRDGNLLKTYVISVLGDITGSGSIKVSDVAKLYQYIKDVIDMEVEYQIAADVNLDGKIKVSDVAKLYQYIKGNIESLEG